MFLFFFIYLLLSPFLFFFSVSFPRQDSSTRRHDLGISWATAGGQITRRRPPKKKSITARAGLGWLGNFVFLFSSFFSFPSGRGEIMDNDICFFRPAGLPAMISEPTTSHTLSRSLSPSFYLSHRFVGGGIDGDGWMGVWRRGWYGNGSLRLLLCLRFFFPLCGDFLTSFVALRLLFFQWDGYGWVGWVGVEIKTGLYFFGTSLDMG